MIYLAKGGFWLTVSQGLGSALTFVLSIAFANLLIPNEYGVYRYVLSLVGIISSFSLSGFGPAVSRAVAKGFDGSYLRGVKIILKWDIILVVITLGCAIYYYAQQNYILGTSLVIAALFTPFLDGFELSQAFLQGKKDFRASSTFQVIRSIIASAGLIITLFLTQNPIIIVVVYYTLHTLATGLNFLYTVTRYKPNSSEEGHTIRLGNHMTVMNLMASVADRIDSILVFHYFGAAQLAMYAFSLAIPTHLFGFIKNLGILAMPKFAAYTGDIDKLKKSVVTRSILLSVLLLPIAALYIVAAPFVFGIFFPQYMNSVFYSQIFGLTLLINGSIPVAFLDAQVAIREKYILSFISNISKLIIIVVGLYFYGILGLIIARIISKLLGVITALVIVRMYKHKPIAAV